jgi:hypothetical protein
MFGQMRLTAKDSDAQNAIAFHIGGTRHERPECAFLKTDSVMSAIDYFIRTGGPYTGLKWQRTTEIEQ